VSGFFDSSIITIGEGVEEGGAEDSREVNADGALSMYEVNPLIFSKTILVDSSFLSVGEVGTAFEICSGRVGALIGEEESGVDDVRFLIIWVIPPFSSFAFHIREKMEESSAAPVSFRLSL